MSVSAMDRLNVPHLLARITSLSELFANSFCEQMCKSVAKDMPDLLRRHSQINHDSVEWCRRRRSCLRGFLGRLPLSIYTKK